jgi:hypothetical protein
VVITALGMLGVLASVYVMMRRVAVLVMIVRTIVFPSVCTAAYSLLELIF